MKAVRFGVSVMFSFSICFMGKIMLTINWEAGFLFIGELGQPSKRWNLSVTVFLVLH